MFFLLPIVTGVIALLGVTWTTSKYQSLLVPQIHTFLYGGDNAPYHIPNTMAYSIKPPAPGPATPSSSANKSLLTVAEDKIELQHQGDYFLTTTACVQTNTRVADTELQPWPSTRTMVIIALSCCFFLILFLNYHGAFVKVRWSSS